MPDCGKNARPGKVVVGSGRRLSGFRSGVFRVFDLASKGISRKHRHRDTCAIALEPRRRQVFRDEFSSVFVRRKPFLAGALRRRSSIPRARRLGDACASGFSGRVRRIGRTPFVRKRDWISALGVSRGLCVSVLSDGFVRRSARFPLRTVFRAIQPFDAALAAGRQMAVRFPPFAFARVLRSEWTCPAGGRSFDNG